MKVVVYCSASELIRPEYFQDAEDLGTRLAVGGHELIYGGGNIGSMGKLASAAHRSGVKITSVIPKFFHDQELTFLESDEIILTEDMQQRRKLMWEKSDCAVALPGGFGTLEEVIEFLVLNQLSLIEKPLVLANIEGYWDPLLKMFDHMMSEKMLSEGHRDLVLTADSAVKGLELLKRKTDSMGERP
ncbi:TIGR00730 family Rossman fold protein [Planctomycetota bacterium]|nr:TIGR00730 family Rossman fold protein [Planctomycetota bacterium]